MVVEIDPEGTLDPDLGVPKRIPETGRMALEVQEVPALDLTVIPMLWSEDPDSAILELNAEMANDPMGHPLLEQTRVLLPVVDLEVGSHDPVFSASNDGYELLIQVEAMYALEGGTGHWMGLMSGEVSGVAGVAVIGGRTSFSKPNVTIMAHELGHNMGLFHAPCGGAFGSDPHYPTPDGSIGAWGYAQGVGLVGPTSADLMTYCEPRWIGDYHFTRALGYRLFDEVEQGSRAVAAPVQSLLLWGGVDEHGDLFLNPAFAVDAPPRLPESAGDHSIVGHALDGRELFSLDFPMAEVSEGGSAFAFVLPARSDWAGSLASVTLSDGDREATLDLDSDVPMAIVRDPVTGRVRAFLRDVPELAGARADAAALAGDSGLTVLFSKGIPDTDAWRR